MAKDKLDLKAEVIQFPKPTRVAKSEYEYKSSSWIISSNATFIWDGVIVKEQTRWVNITTKENFPYRGNLLWSKVVYRFMLLFGKE